MPIRKTAFLPWLLIPNYTKMFLYIGISVNMLYLIADFRSGYPLRSETQKKNLNIVFRAFCAFWWRTRQLLCFKENYIFFCRNLDARSGTESASSKNLDSYCFVTSLWLFIFGCKSTVPSKSKKQKISFLFASCRLMKKIAGSGSISQRHGSADLDPYQNVTDPQHCSRPYQIFPQRFLLSRCKFRITRIRISKGPVKFQKNRMSASLWPSSSSPSSTSMILVWLREEEPIDFQPYSSMFDSE